MLRINFISLFPDMALSACSHSILGRASKAGLVSFSATDPRDFTFDKHHKVDDVPFGGEPGMLIKAEPVALALEHLPQAQRRAVVLTDPAGSPFTQAAAHALSSLDQVVFLCGHYEGFDHRVKTELATHAFSIGDYVLTNGELPALVMADAIVRLVPGVLGAPESLEADSHVSGILSAPNFTRPPVWRGLEVPPVLLSGNHAEIAKWRRREALRLTRDLRPDLLAKATLTKQDLKLLEE